MPGTFEDTIELLVPELQRRGILWDDFHVPGGTYRENLFEMKGQHEPLPEHPAAKLIWRAPVKGAHSVNGTGHAINGYASGYTEEHEHRLDPMATQLS